METLLSLTLSGSAVALLLLLLRYGFLKKLPSTVYYYAWLLVLLRFLLPLPGLIPTGSGAAAPAPAAGELPLLERHRESVQAEPAAEWLPAAEDGAYTPVYPAAVSPAAPAEAEEETPAATPAPATAPARPAIDWASPRLWLGVWGLGAVLCLGWPVFSYLRFTRRLRRELREPGEAVRALYASLPGRKPRLYICAALKTPLMFGIFAPRIILPAGVSDPETLENVLRHELTHYRRRDPLYKWFAAAVLALHWFNPLSWLIRRELNRACELSCDETLLRSMDRAEKQAYGETLLRMAASSALPAGVVATTFSTEKKNLKERLEQIMHYKKSKSRVLAAVLALLLLCGCGAAAGPAAGSGTEAEIVPADASEAEGRVVQVSDVDGLLAAIAPNTTVELAPGVYDLSTASGYGEASESEYYGWIRLYGEAPDTPNYELEIRNVEGLTLRGAGMDETTVAAVPRHANVIRFSRCRNVSVSALTAGHTEAPGICSGGVLRFDACNAVTVDGCGLFGCGTVGVWAVDCTGLTVTGSRIYECSYAAVDVSSCREVLVENCEIDRNGVKIEGADALSLFSASNSDGFTVVGCRIHDNQSQKLLTASYTRNALFLSNRVSDNHIPTCLFQIDQYPVTVDGCAFSGNDASIWIYGDGVFPVDAQGNALDAEALAAMEYREIDPASVLAAKPLAAATEVPAGGSVSVRTVDEFLSAIGSDRTIVLEGELFDLSTAADYGSFGSESYYWRETFDGPELVITGVSGLTIRAAAPDPKATTLAAVPRYANVLRFQSCDNISLVGFTAGHTEEPGECSGGVLDFDGCNGVDLEACRLYGCGTLGVSCLDCTGFAARDCEIYACSQGGVSMSRTDGIAFEGCSIHGVPSPALRFNVCGDKSWNGEPMMGTEYDLRADGSLLELERDLNETSYEEYQESLYPFDLLPPRNFREGEPPDETLVLARAVQTNIVEGNWEALSKQLYYPFYLFTADAIATIPSEEEFLSLDLDTLLTPEFRRQIADTALDGFGASLFGNTFCGGYLAFGQDRNAEEPPLLRLTAISAAVPMPDNRIPEGLRVYEGGRVMTEFTLHKGDAVALHARVYPLGLFPDAEITWTVSDPQALKLEPNGRDCRIEALQSVQGGVTLTAEFHGVTWEMTVYIADAQPAPTPAPAP